LAVFYPIFTGPRQANPLVNPAGGPVG